MCAINIALEVTFSIDDGGRLMKTNLNLLKASTDFDTKMEHLISTMVQGGRNSRVDGGFMSRNSAKWSPGVVTQ